jgi:hypothetical protein
MCTWSVKCTGRNCKPPLSIDFPCFAYFLNKMRERLVCASNIARTMPRTSHDHCVDNPPQRHLILRRCLLCVARLKCKGVFQFTCPVSDAFLEELGVPRMNCNLVRVRICTAILMICLENDRSVMQGTTPFKRHNDEATIHSIVTDDPDLKPIADIHPDAADLVSWCAYLKHWSPCVSRRVTVNLSNIYHLLAHVSSHTVQASTVHPSYS